MRSIANWLVILVVMTAVLPPAWAHSLKELEATLADKEKFFQPLDRPAPGFSLRDPSGAAVSLADFRGKVVVLNFVYTNCPDVCPLHTARIAEIQSMINDTPMKSQVAFITITTDPKRDTGQALRDYGAAHGLDPVNWVFLTAGQDQQDDVTRKLAESYGHKFTKTADGYQVHGIVTHVIDREGRWRANFHGLKFESVNMVLFVNALVNDVHPSHAPPEVSFWDRVRNIFR